MDEYVGNEWPGYTAPMPKHGHKGSTSCKRSGGSADDRHRLRTHHVQSLRQCALHDQRGDAVKKRDDGIMLIDPIRAKGRKDLVEACPYGHIWWNEELQLPQIWPFDAHLLDQVAADPRAAIVSDRSHARNQGRGRQSAHGAPGGLEVMKPEAGTNRGFITAISGAIRNASSAAPWLETNDIIDCVEAHTCA
jgi:hypothetical protein